MLHKKTSAESPSPKPEAETQSRKNASLNKHLDTNPTKIYVNLAGNPYFRQTREAAGAFPMALTLRLSRQRSDLVERIKQYSSKQLPKGSILLEDLSNPQTHHLLILFTENAVLESLLDHPLREEALFSNTSGSKLTTEALLDKAKQLDSQT